MNTFDDILKALLALPESDRLRLYDRIARYAVMELAALSGESSEKNVCSCIGGNILSIPSIPLATPNVDSNHSIYNNILNIDSSYIESSAKKKKENPQYNNTQGASLVTDTDKNEAQAWMDLYNTTCVSYAKATKLTDARIEWVAARLRRFTREDFQKACENMEASEWLRGRGFGCFDWIIKTDENLSKLAEGMYNRKPSRPRGVGTIKGRPALLARLLGDAAKVFDRSTADTINMALLLEESIVKDKYYSQLTAADFEEIFRRGCSRQFAFHGFSVSTICGWMNEYKDTFKEQRRVAQMRGETQEPK